MDTARVNTDSKRSPRHVARKPVESSGCTTIERSLFSRRVELPHLGIKLVVDEERADYVPDRPERTPRSSLAEQRRSRVQLASFLSDCDPEGVINEQQGSTIAVQSTIEALSSLPPGVLSEMPYLRHVQQRCEVDLRQIEAIQLTENVSAEEEDLFRHFASHLAGLAHQVDSADVEQEFRSFVKQRAEPLPLADTHKPVRPLGRPAKHIANRPMSAKFMMHTTEKRCFLTELIDRADVLKVPDRPESGRHVHDIRPPQLHAATATAATSVANRQQSAAHRLVVPNPDILQQSAAQHDHVKTVGQLRFNLRSAKSTHSLVRRGICRPNSAVRLGGCPDAVQLGVQNSL
jgi:hypothetical protein